MPLTTRLGMALALATAFAGLVFLRTGPEAPAWLALPVLGFLALTVVVDVTRRMIPDVITLPGIGYALGVSLATGRPSLPDALLGALLGGGVLLAAAVISGGAVGGGDVKLMTMLGLVLGWEVGLAVLGLSQLIAALVAIAALAMGKGLRSRLPIGAVLAMVGALAIIGA